jgi:hypothetical protein
MNTNNLIYISIETKIENNNLKYTKVMTKGSKSIIQKQRIIVRKK